jgi:hypothetical protein
MTPSTELEQAGRLGWGVWDGRIRQMSEASGAILGELFTPEDELGEVKRVEEGDSLLPRPPSAREGPSFWKSDVAFGRQFTQGIHSTMLEVCREVPPELVYGLPLTSIRFRTAYTLADEAKDGRVYKVDYRCAALPLGLRVVRQPAGSQEPKPAAGAIFGPRLQCTSGSEPRWVRASLGAQCLGLGGGGLMQLHA